MAHILFFSVVADIIAHLDTSKHTHTCNTQIEHVHTLTYKMTGDWLMSLAQSMCCSPFQLFKPTIVAYFNPIYFIILLIHRERRDDLRCSKKYGKDWYIYTQQVTARMFPGIY